MASITNRNSKVFRDMGLEDDEGPEPAESEATLFLKDLSQKQLSKHSSLKEQLSLKQNFVRSSTEELSISLLPAGKLSLDGFAATSFQLNTEKMLLSRGIDKQDLKFFYEMKKGKQHLKQKYPKLEPTALDSRIDHVINRIKVAISVDNSSSLFHQSASGSKSYGLEANLPEDKTTNSTYPLHHPINQLADIEKSLFGHLWKEKDQGSPPSKIYQAKKRKQEEDEHISYLKEGESQWDKKKQKKYKIPETTKETATVKTCAPQVYYTIKDGKSVFLGRNPPKEVPKEEAAAKPVPGTSFVAPDLKSLIPLETIKRNCLPEKEILKVPKFQNYEKGAPSKTLFLKNLSGSVGEKDLTEIFGNFEQNGSPTIVYRLMGGKMRGQAFITFPDVATAGRALNCVNGYHLKGKPIIILFGKKS